MLINEENKNINIAVIVTCPYCQLGVQKIFQKNTKADISIYVPDYETQLSVYKKEIRKIPERSQEKIFICKYSNSGLDHPIEFLSRFDEIYILGKFKNKENISNYPDVSNGMMGFIWLSINLDIPTYYMDKYARLEINNNIFYDKHNPPENIKNYLQRRINRTKSLTEILLDNDWGSSGLWTQGYNIPYDSIDIPFNLIKRIAAWQKSFDDTLDTVCSGNEPGQDWKERHYKEAESIADELRKVLPTVKIYVSIFEYMFDHLK